MSTLTANSVLPSNVTLTRMRRRTEKKSSTFPVARLLGPAIFDPSKLNVVFLGVGNYKEYHHPLKVLPRIYTITHCDITSKLTLAISENINNSQIQGWYNRLQRDEVIAEWKKIKGKMSLHVHCHISGGHFLLNLFAKLRYYIFCKELPVVLKAFLYGDYSLFSNYPELQNAMTWVYFHSNIQEFNKIECWGPLSMVGSSYFYNNKENVIIPQPCKDYYCTCCSRSTNLVVSSKSSANVI